MKTVAVVGGLTVDLTYFVPEWPEVKKAPQAKSYRLSPGGKGLNIATALKRLGANVKFISAVGKDNLSEVVFRALVEERLSTEGIFVKEDAPTDLITIIINPQGKAGFIGTQAANQRLERENIEEVRGLIEASAALIVTLEIPSASACLALEIAKRKGILTIFNPSPSNDFPKKVLQGIDYFIPNRREAGVLARKESLSSRKLCQKFLSFGPQNVIITEHEKGGVWGSKRRISRYPAFSVKTVDETGAGDAFCASLCMSLLRDNNLEEALMFASAAGALACTKVGARDAMPTGNEVESFLRENMPSAKKKAA